MNLSESRCMEECTRSSRCHSYLYNWGRGYSCVLNETSIENFRDRKTSLDGMNVEQLFKLPVYNDSSVNFTINWSKIQPGKKYAVTCFSDDYTASAFTNITFARSGQQPSSPTKSGGLTTQQELDDIKR